MAAPILNSLFEKADQDRDQFKDESRTDSSDDLMRKSDGLNDEQVESPRANEDENKKWNELFFVNESRLDNFL